MLEDFRGELSWTKNVSYLNESWNLLTQILLQFDCMVGLTVHYLDDWVDFVDCLWLIVFVGLEFWVLLGH